MSQKNANVEKPKQIKLKVELSKPVVYAANTYVEPRVCTISVAAVDADSGAPLPDCNIAWKTSDGVIDIRSSTQTGPDGKAYGYFYSFSPCKAKVRISAAKQGYLLGEAETEIEVVETSVRVKVVNEPALGEIYLEGKKMGDGSAELMITKPGIYVVSWGAVEGYLTPDPVKLYVNPNFSTEPMEIRGRYIPRDGKREFVEVRVFVCITLDDVTGVPNPVPNAVVYLSDGQTGVADSSGMAVFKVRAGHGPLTIKAKHPQLYECYQVAEVNIGEKDVHVNLDFGIFFGGEAVVGLEDF
ncbi:MAG: hypothetical protein QXV97_02665 [Candidatus Caldarchaeum sp.]